MGTLSTAASVGAAGSGRGVGHSGGRRLGVASGVASTVVSALAVAAAAGMMVGAGNAVDVGGGAVLGGVWSGGGVIARGAPVEPPASAASAGVAEPMEPPAGAPAVVAAVTAEFLSAEESRALRVLYGRARASDLVTPALRAQWNLTVGRAAAVARDAAAPGLDRAEAMSRLGDAAGAVKVLDGLGEAERASPRAVHVRVAALESMGKFAEAITAAEGVLGLVARPTEAKSAEEIVHAVATAALVADLRAPAGGGSGGGGGGEHLAMMRALKHAREALDPLDWRVVLMEGVLLYRKDNPEQAQQSFQQVLAMNPKSAEAWFHLGEMAVDAFDLGSMEAIAARLDVLAADEGEEGGGAGDAGAGGEKMPEEKKAGDEQAGDVVRAGAEVSAEAALLRARGMLRQNAPELAEEFLAAALEAYPAHRRLREMAAAAAGGRYEFERMDALLAELDKLAPGSARGLARAGQVVAESRQYEQAIRLLSAAVERQPWWPEPQIDLGLLHIQAGNDAEAIAVLKRATELDPFNVRAANQLKLAEELAGYQRLESAHFVVRATGAADAFVAAEMLPVLDGVFEAVTGAPERVEFGLDHAPARKTMIDLMPNQARFAVRIVGIPRIHTVAASTGPIIAMAAPREGRGNLGLFDWPRVLKHEYVHTVGLSKTGNRLPHWFTEAQATFMERSPLSEPTAQLLAKALEDGELFEGAELNLAFVRPKKPTDRQLAYAQGRWMYEYMVATHGARSPLGLMELYATGVREAEAYPRVLGVTREEFFERFKAWARGQVEGWGLALKAGVPSVEELKGKVMGEGVEEWTEEGLKAALAEHPEHPELLEIAVGRALEANGGKVTAETASVFERYAAARPVAALPHQRLAAWYLSMEGAGDGGPGVLGAIPHLEWLDAREERSASYAAQLAVLHARAGNLEAAWGKAVRATRISPYDPRHRERAAAIALQRGDLSAARHHVTALTVLEPEQAIHRQRLEAVEARMKE